VSSIRGVAPSWSEIARAWPDGEGRVTVSDASVVAGARYAYRLAPLAGGAALGETWIEVPLAATALALRLDYPGLPVLPVCADFTARFALPSVETLALLFGAAPFNLEQLELLLNSLQVVGRALQLHLETDNRLLLAM